MLFSLIRKRVSSLFLFFIFLPSCASKAWIYKEIRSDCDAFRSALLHYPAQNPLCGIEIKFLKGSFGTTCRLGLHQGGIYDASTCLTCIMGEERRSFQAHVLEGGQCLELSEEGIATITDCLSRGENLTLLLEKHYEYVSASNFPRLYPDFFN